MSFAPMGSSVKIYRNKEVITDVELLLEEDLVLNLSSTFAPLVSGEANKNFTAMSGFAQSKGFNVNFTGQFKQFGFQQWTSTAPLGFSFTIGLYMRTNAATDVMIPAYELMKLPLPTDLGNSNIKKGKIGLKAPGPSIGGALIDSDNMFISVGPILINPIIVKKVEPTFGLYTDEMGNYTSCVLRIDVESVFTATTNMIDDFQISGMDIDQYKASIAQG